jgi:hypothetical protein
MLAPGEMLTTAVRPEPSREPAARRIDLGPTPAPFPALTPVMPPAKSQEPEPRSFLLALLRALGGLHS